METKTKQNRGKRGSRKQKSFLISYMEENIGFSHERFEGDSGAMLHQQKWLVLANKLNAIGGCKKTAEKWKQYWRDLKRLVKGKAAEEKRKLEESGRNGLVTLHLTKLDDLEKRVVSIITPDLVDGDSKSQEKGFSKPTIAYLDLIKSSTVPFEVDLDDITVSELPTLQIPSEVNNPNEVCPEVHVKQKVAARGSKRSREPRMYVQTQPKLDAIMNAEKEKLELEREKFEFKKKNELEKIMLKKQKLDVLQGIEKLLKEIVNK